MGKVTQDELSQYRGPAVFITAYALHLTIIQTQKLPHFNAVHTCTGIAKQLQADLNRICASYSMTYGHETDKYASTWKY